ncbi:MAG: putative phage abortive infection protein [Clostridiales bacterium]
MQKTKKYSIYEIVGYVFTFIGIILFIWFVVRSCHDKYIIWNNPISLDNASKFGDFVGGFIGVMFTISGVFLLFATLTLQRKEFMESRKAFHKQQLETSLFNLLSSQREMLMNISYKEHNGRLFFTFIKSELRKAYNLIMDTDTNNINSDTQTIIYEMLTIDYVVKRHKKEKSFFDDDTTKVTAFKEIFKDIDKSKEKHILSEAYWIVFYKYHNYYGHYFRHLYHILKFLDIEQSFEMKNDFPNNAKGSQYLADIVQATLSSDELFVLFCNGLCFNNMKKYLHKFAFLENLPKEDLFKPEHDNFYSEEEIDGVKYSKINFKSMDNSVS